MNKSSSRSQRGYALLIVTMAIAIIGVLVQMFILSSQAELRSVRAEGDRIKARYISYSVLEVTKLFLKVQEKFLDNNAMLSQMGLDMGQFLPMILPLFFGDVDMVGAMIGTDVVGLGMKPGQGSGGMISMDAEDGKININCAISDANIQQLNLNLTALFSSRRYDELFGRLLSDSDSLDRVQQVGAFIDFIDLDQGGYAGGDEDGYYMGLSEPYVSKNNLLDSNEEIRLIRGVDDVFWTNFGSSLTVYGSCNLNLCAVDSNNWQLVAGIIVASAKDPNHKVINDPVLLKMLATTVAPQIPGICKDTSTFIQAVANPGVASNVMAAALGISADEMSDLGNDGVNDAEVQGVELDQSKLSKIVTSASKRFYRLKVYGVSGKSKHMVNAVWDQKLVSTSSGKTGGFVYWREE
ncbi:MAG: general secretion pathway protein GspK [Deltaproteobacteria bacterium]|nr:general secretion pathway protein GspK [Deltaproteobacteria bacterium]